MKGCFAIVVNKGCGQGTTTPSHVENVGTSSLVPGSFFFDEAEGIVFYKSFGEDETARLENGTVEVIMPLLEYLINADGMSDLTFENLSFEHATYSKPNSDEGYVEMQSGALCTYNCTCDDKMWFAMPSNVRFEHSHNINFDSCIFARYVA